MQQLMLFTIIGLTTGAVYGIMGLGVVAIYRGSGVLNLGQISIALLAAYTFSATAPRLGIWTALVVVLVATGALGGLFYIAVMRQLREAPLLTKLVGTLGLMLAIQGLVPIVFGSSNRTAPTILPQGKFNVFGVTLGVDRIFLLLIGVAVAGALEFIFRFTKFGLATRGASENEKGAILVGISPGWVGAANWTLGAGLGALGGILISPMTTLDPGTFSLLIIPTLAAALVGKFESFRVTMAAGMGVGVVQSLLQYYYPNHGAPSAAPFVIILAVMMLIGRRFPERGIRNLRLPVATQAKFHPFICSGFAAIIVVLIFWLSPQYLSALTLSLIFVLPCLSIVVVTGYVGQISLVQLSIAGLGGLAASILAEKLGLPFLLVVPAAGLCMVPVGLLIGSPSLKVRGLGLAVVTLAAGVVLDQVIFADPVIGGGYSGRILPSPTLFAWSLDPNRHPQRFALTVGIVVALGALMVSRIRRGTSGRAFLAVRNNERAGAAAGVNPASMKLVGFAIAAFLAGVAGALFGYAQGLIVFSNFSVIDSVVLLSTAFIGGLGSVAGAFVAGTAAPGGIMFVLFNQIAAFGNLQILLAGIFVINTALVQPQGVAPFFGEKLARLNSRRSDLGSGVSPITPGAANPAEPNLVGPS
jgi:branched-chain amino acid transport system permease protein